MAEFVVRDYNNSWPKAGSYPAVYLTNDNWDDYGFQTFYRADLVVSPEASPVELGHVKIMKRGQTGGRTKLPGDRFSRLTDQFCSLGHDFAYYEALSNLGPGIRDEVLGALRDAARFPNIHAEFRDEEAFRVSLLRESSASRALIDAGALFANGSTAQQMDLRFSTHVGGDPFELDLVFGDNEDLPSRICAVIGYNGVGKTRLLANLATVAQTNVLDRRSEGMPATFGEFVGSNPEFSVVVSVSYSAFDTFHLPSGNGGHRYCGLRRLSGEEPSVGSMSMALEPVENPASAHWVLKSTSDIMLEFLDAMEVAKRRDRLKIFEATVEPLAMEPSFAAVDVRELLELSRESVQARFETLSTGHKIVLNIVTQLVANLQPNALVLLDEPESHLHPPLLAALFRGLSAALKGFNSFALVATHSPVVLQEIPRRYVRILQRAGTVTTVVRPQIETFGENIGLLTRLVFSLDNSDADFQGVLRRLHADMGIDEIARLFDGSLSSQAEAFLLSLSTGDDG